MEYHLSYHPNGRFRIDQTGKTINTADTTGFILVASSDDLNELRTFARTATYCAGLQGICWTPDQVKRGFKSATILEHLFAPGDF